jgi:hypothetical protein
MRRIVRVALTTAAVLMAAAPGARAATWQPVEQHRARGGVDATLAYDKRLDRFGLTVYRNIRLEVRHGETSVFEGPVCGGPRCQPFDGRLRGGYDLGLHDVWGDEKPEAVVEIYTGYAHCCFQTAMVLVGDARRGRLVFRDWGNVPERIERHGGDAYLVSGDNRFAYAFTSYAASWFPVQAWQLDETGAFVDVTRERPDLVRADAKRAWKAYLREREKGDARGILAAWCADQYLLDDRDACLTALGEALVAGYANGSDTWASGRAYVTLVRRKLAAWGYAG